MSRIARVAAGAEARRRVVARRLRVKVARLAAVLRDGAAREPRPRRRAWIAVTALLVIGPLAFNLARESSYETSVVLFPQAVRPYPPILDPGYYRALLDDPVLREQMRLNAGGSATADYGDVTFRRGSGQSPIILVVEAPTPARSQRFINALAPQIAGATQRQLARAAAGDAVRVRTRLLTNGSPPRERTLRRRLRRLEGFGDFPPPRVLPGAGAERPRIEGWADNLVDELPGDFRPRPSPVWAAFAGLLVAATLWGIGLVLVPPRRT